MSYNSNRASNFKSSTRSAGLKLPSRLLPRLYSTQSNYHYILYNTVCLSEILRLLSYVAAHHCRMACNDWSEMSFYITSPVYLSENLCQVIAVKYCNRFSSPSSIYYGEIFSISRYYYYVSDEKVMKSLLMK